MTERPMFPTDQALRRHMTEFADAQTPDYLEAAIERASTRRQRPAWTYPGRWIPVADIAGRPAFAPSVPWRTLGAALIIVAILLAAVAVYVGTRQTKLPPPFGPARNGLVTYTADGDIYVADTVSGSVKRLTETKSIRESESVFAPNGLRLAYRRPVDGAVPYAEDIVAVKPDGSDPIVLTKAPLVGGAKRLEWSPDSRSILATADDDSAIWIFDASGEASVQTIATDAYAFVRPFRPPDGSAILIARVKEDTHGSTHSVILHELASGKETTLAADLQGYDGATRWSPDGSQVVYSAAPADEPDAQRLFVVAADGSSTHKLVTAPDITVNIDPAWSPDGTHIAFTRYQEQPNHDWDVLPIGVYSVADGSVRSVGPLPRDVRARYPGANDAAATRGEGFFFDWSPDGRSLIAYPSEAVGHALLIDTIDGTWRALDPVIDTVGFPRSQGWQRLAE